MQETQFGSAEDVGYGDNRFMNFINDFWSKREIYDDLNHYKISETIKREFKETAYHGYLN